MVWAENLRMSVKETNEMRKINQEKIKIVKMNDRQNISGNFIHGKVNVPTSKHLCI